MRVHCIGIGGIGVSALAQYYLAGGAAVSGSDLVSSEITDELSALGVSVAIGKHKKNNVPKQTDVVIYTAATPQENPELVAAKEKRMKAKTYAEAIGELTKQYRTITVSGSHGKSTTTALIALVLEEGGFDPTVIVGTKIKEFGHTNFRKGTGQYLVLEADEWNRSFLHYAPHIAVVTNIDAEHLDTYKTVEGVEKAFAEYLSKIPTGGAIVANKDDARTRNIAKKFGKKVRWYSLQEDPVSRVVGNVLKVPGEHNVSNALAALWVGRTLGIPESSILKALGRFRGTWRRFDFMGKMNGASIFSDYGHHPREIVSTIRAARSRFPMRRVWCVYQPHQYQRLQYLWDDFVHAFDDADHVCLLPVYGVAGREKGRTNLNSAALAREILKRGKDAYHMNSFAEAKTFMGSRVRAGDVVLVMGAGDIYILSQELSTGHV